MLVMARGPSKLTLLQDFVIPHHVVDEANIIPRQCYDQETGMFCTSPTVYTILTLPSPSPILPRYRISVPPNSSSKLHTPSTQTQSPPLSTKLTIGAAILLGVSILVSPFKEGSPAKIIMNTTDILLQERRRKKMVVISLAWWKASYALVLVHLWAVIVAVVAWWKVSRG
jgi:hypothetical protein